MNTYNYSFVKYRDTLSGSPNFDVPIAIVVESHGDASIMGIYPDMLMGNLSEISRQVVTKLPEILLQQIQDARKNNPKISIMDVLAENNRWNIYLTKTEQVSSPHSLKEITFLLFAQTIKDNNIMAVPEPVIERPFYLDSIASRGGSHQMQFQFAGD